MENTYEHKVIIHRRRIHAMFHMYKNDLFCVLCRNILKNKLVENGIHIQRNSNLVELDDSVKYDWLKFVVDVLDMILVLGICPVRFDRKKKTPYVPPYGHFEIQIFTKRDGTRRYELHDEQYVQEAVKDCIFLVGFGFDPSADAELSSLVKTLEPTIKFIANMQDCAIQAEFMRSNPPIVTERKELRDEKQEGVNFDFFADADAVKNNAGSVYRRDEAAVEQLKRQKRLFASAIGDEETNAEKALDNVMPLPTGYVHAATLQATARTDFVSMNRLYQESICAVLGVPRSMIITDSNVKSDLVGAHQIFRQTLLWWRETLERSLTRTYRIIYSSIEVKKMTNIAKRRKLGGGFRVGSGDEPTDTIIVEEIARKNLPSIALPVAPYLEVDDLKELYQQEIINWETYCKYMLRTSSLPEEDLNTRKDPWNHEDRKAMLGISQKLAELAPKPKSKPKNVSMKPDLNQQIKKAKVTS